ncbi:Mediator complex subunit Med17 [Neofusicoccum parvum]|uniref:Mediator complex subunit Med17 n=1 Tax=Neofusicoccum parvum TaxID=310453 RepID=A0ACB5S7C0_9PEZI|nr:Mediator complex subunit Med17 [Neofusicoccum parvum]
MAALSRPLQTTAAFSLPSTSDKSAALHQDLTITLRTLVAPPIQGTEINLTIPPSLAAILYHDNRQAQKRTLSFDTLEALKEYLDHALSMDLAHNIAAKEHRRCRASDRDPELVYGAKREKEGENKEAVQIRVETHLSGRDGRLRVAWYAPDGQLEGKEAVWREDEGESRNFAEVAGSFVNISVP